MEVNPHSFLNEGTDVSDKRPVYPTISMRPMPVPWTGWTEESL